MLHKQTTNYQKFEKKVVRFLRRCQGVRGNTGQRRGLSKGLDNFRKFIVSLIISLFISKL